MKEEDGYFKVRWIININFQNFVIFSFQITKIKTIKIYALKIPELLVIFIFDSLHTCFICFLTYLHLNYGQIFNKRRILRCGIS